VINPAEKSYYRPGSDNAGVMGGRAAVGRSHRPTTPSVYPYAVAVETLLATSVHLPIRKTFVRSASQLSAYSEKVEKCLLAGVPAARIGIA